jgi:hypothetical protein
MNILLALQQLLALVEKGTRPLARAHRLTPEDLLVLAWLRANGAMELSQFARSCGRSRQNLHRTLLRLERAELALAMRPDRELMNTHRPLGHHRQGVPSLRRGGEGPDRHREALVLDRRQR